MKKLTLLLVATVMLSGGAFAEGKCCKKGHKCTEKSACCKDKKHCNKDSKEGTANTNNSNNPKMVKKENPKM